MVEATRQQKFEQLVEVIGWEMDCQKGIGRAYDDLPVLIADTLLDFFDVCLLPGADATGLREHRT
jgi:hypothetical protein